MEVDNRTIFEVFDEDPVISEIVKYFREELGILPPPFDMDMHYTIDEFRDYLIECKKQKRNDVKWKYSIERPPIEEWRRIKNTPSRKRDGRCMRRIRWYWTSRKKYKAEHKN